MSVERSPSSGPVLPPRIADFRIAGRLVRPSLNRVETPERTLSLEPKVMRVLVRLAERPGRVVTKEELFRDVWEGAYVTEDVLTRAVGELRRVFADAPGNPRVIETIRKSGYRLIAPVLEEDSAPEDGSSGIPAPPEAPASRTAASPARRRRLAGAAFLAAVAAGLAFLFLARERPRPASRLRVRPLTSLPGNERDPAVSPDGSRVAFVWNGGAGESTSLYVQLIDGETPLRLTSTPGVEDRAPAWSSDGQRLAFTRSSPSDCRILVVSALGGEESPLAPCGDRDHRRLAWSPDGRWLAFPRREASGSLALELLSPETLESRTRTRPPAGTLGDTSPEFSPDGRTLAFTRNITDGVNDIYRVPVDGGEPTRLTFDNRDTMGSTWSEDGRSLVFSSSRAGIYSLWRVSVGGGEPTWVAGGGTKMKHPSAARGRRLLAFENWIYEVNLWRVPLGPGASGRQPLRLTEATDEWNFEPHLSPDGRRAAFVSTRSGSEEIWVVALDGTGAKRLTSFRGARLETPRWSPDGRRIVFSGRVPARADLYLVSAEGGVPERLTAEATDAVAPDWSRDGRSVYFASRRGRGSWQVWRLELEGRRMTPVTTGGGYAARESHDGRWIYFTRTDEAGLWRQSRAAGGRELCERVTDRLAPEDWSNWEVGARGIYFRELCPRHEGPAVAFLADGASAPVDLAPLPEQGWPGFAVSGDGEFLVYPRIDRHTCDIRLIENPA
jgi:Tol biopolymer transport system component/DNA-binding winged helix-turn-helix (wHTH) protein